MSAREFSDAMSVIDGKYIDEAIAYDKNAGRSLRFHRIPMAAAAAVLALLLLGCAVLAAGGFGTQLMSFFHSDAESGYDLGVAVERVPMDALSAELGEIGGVIKQQFRDSSVFDSWYPGSWQTSFSSRDLACDYIGYDRLKRVDLGYDEQETLLDVLGNERGQILSLDLETRYSAEAMNVQFFSEIFTEYYEDEIEIDTRTTESLEYEESFYSTAGGATCRVILSSAMASGYLCMDGYIVDDGVLYTLHIAYRSDASAQAEELMHHWADLLTAAENAS